MDQSTNLNVMFRVLHVDEAEHSLLVRYWTDNVSEDSLATEFEHAPDGSVVIKRDENGAPTQCRTDVNLTIYNENATQEEIIDIIKASAPVDWFKLKTKKASDHLKTLHGHVDSFVHEEKEPAGIRPMTDDEIDAFLETKIKKIA